VTLVGVQLQPQAAIPDLVSAAQVFEAGERITEGKNGAAIVEAEAFP